MKITIGAFDKANTSVPVTFEGTDAAGAAVTHERTVNACLDATGKYDAAATAKRVDQVAAGVAVMIANGAITNAPPMPTMTADNPDTPPAARRLIARLVETLSTRPA